MTLEYCNIMFREIETLNGFLINSLHAKIWGSVVVFFFF